MPKSFNINNIFQIDFKAFVVNRKKYIFFFFLQVIASF